MDELLEALVVEETDCDLERECMLEPSAIIECCKSLVLYDTSSGLVRFAHETVHEYIASHLKHDIPQHCALAKTCLTYLSFDEFDISGECMEQRLKTYKLGRYAASFWSFHTREAEECEEVQHAVLACLMSENKRNSMLQMAAYARGKSDITGGQTVLHVLAENGLTTTCGLLLDQALQGDHTYRLYYKLPLTEVLL
jgi:hypothetical protein